MRSDTHNKDGSPTHMGFACGYTMEAGTARLCMRDGVYFLSYGPPPKTISTFRRKEMTKAKREFRRVVRDERRAAPVKSAE